MKGVLFFAFEDGLYVYRLSFVCLVGDFLWILPWDSSPINLNLPLGEYVVSSFSNHLNISKSK